MTRQEFLSLQSGNVIKFENEKGKSIFQILSFSNSVKNNTLVNCLCLHTDFDNWQLNKSYEWLESSLIDNKNWTSLNISNNFIFNF